MAGGYAVERSDLRGWSRQVGRASDDMGSANKYATAHTADADFGLILDLITGPYDSLLTQFHSILVADSARLGKTSDALDAAERMYRGMEVNAVDDFARLDKGDKGTVTQDGEAKGFKDGESAANLLVPPRSDGVELPEVSFGWLLDKACELISFVGGPDPREAVTKWLVGDLGKVNRQVQAWGATADCTEAVKGNLASGQEAISHTWKGDAASAAGKRIREWLDSLDEQSIGIRKMGEHLRTAADEAFKMAQVVVDIIKTVGSLASAALTNAAIPFYGQWKLIKSGKEAVRMVWQAIKVIKVFWNLLKTIVDFIDAVITSFNVEALPSTPGTVVR